MIRIFIAALLHFISSFTQAQENPIDAADQAVIEERFTDHTELGFVIEEFIVHEELHDNFYDTGIEGRFNWTCKLTHHSYQMYGNGFAYNGVVFQGNDLRFDPLKFDVNDKDLTFEIGF